jgi:tetratricopeptide (TPR) repeat protein
MSFLRKFNKEVLGKSPDGKPRAKDSSAVDGKAPSSGGLINPFAEDQKSVEPDGGKTPAPGGLINPFAEDEPAAPEAQAVHGKEDAAPAEDSQAQAKKLFEEADALYKKKQYAKAAAQYRLAYQSANGDQRGAIAFNVAQAFRLSNSFPSAAVWYQKALTLGGPTVSKYREEIEQRLAEMQGETKKHFKPGPDGEDLGEAQMLFEEAQIAYDDHDYAKAEPLYKEAYARSNRAPILFNIAQACRLGGKYGDAKYWYREYLKKEPKSPYKAEVEERIEEMKKKAPDVPKDGDAGSIDDAKKKFEQADRLYKAGKYSEAADLYAEVYYDPAVAFARGQVAFNMGQCMRLTGKKASAVEWYKKALEYLPADSPYRDEIAGRIAELTGAKAAKP